jgi:hypothetical protein
MFELFSDIYFVVYKLYYVGQNDNLDIRVSLKNWDRGSSRYWNVFLFLILIDFLVILWCSAFLFSFLYLFMFVSIFMYIFFERKSKYELFRLKLISCVEKIRI